MTLLILTGRYLGFLPDHAAQPFVERGEMCVVGEKRYHYDSRHAAIIRKTPAPSRMLTRFMSCLTAAHHGPQTGEAI